MVALMAAVQNLVQSVLVAQPRVRPLGNFALCWHLMSAPTRFALKMDAR